MRWPRSLALVLLGLVAAPPAFAAGSTVRVRSGALFARASRAELLPLAADWTADDSSATLLELLEGTADVAVTARALSPRERELAFGLGLELDEHLLALDGLAVAVHPGKPIDRLSLAELASILTGEMRRWHGVGGILEAVHPVLPHPSAGLARNLREMVLQGGELGSEVEVAPPAVTVARVDFGYRGSRLGALAVRTLAELGARLRETGDRVWITGHSEPTEIAPSDLSLSEARAFAVADFLRSEGIAPGRIESAWLGADEPRVPNLTLEGRRENRRADVWILFR